MPPLSVVSVEPEPPPHEEMERMVARAMELWLKMRTPNFPPENYLKGVCQKMAKACLANVVNDFPSARRCRNRSAHGNDSDAIRATDAMKRGNA